MSEKAPVNYNPNDINAVLAGINTTLSNMEKQLTEINQKLDKHNERLTVLENFRFLLLGAVGIISWASSYFFTKIKGS